MTTVVHQLTERARRNGRAVNGPWEVTREGDEMRLYHYGVNVAAVNLKSRSRAAVRVAGRPGHGISVSDQSGISSFAGALRLSDRVEPYRRDSRAYEYGSLYRYKDDPTLIREREGDSIDLGALQRTHIGKHTDASHHIGPCSAACRRGLMPHLHRRSR